MVLHYLDLGSSLIQMVPESFEQDLQHAMVTPNYLPPRRGEGQHKDLTVKDAMQSPKWSPPPDASIPTAEIPK